MGAVPQVAAPSVLPWSRVHHKLESFSDYESVPMFEKTFYT